MKKILAILLASALVLALFTGCGSSAPAAPAAPADNTAKTESSEPAAEVQTETVEEPAVASLEGWKLGTTDMSGTGYPFYVATHNMLLDVCETTGIDLGTTTLAGYDDASILAAYENLIDQGCNLISVATFSEGTLSLVADLMEENNVNWFLANRRISDPDLKEKVYACEHFVGNSYCDEEVNAYELTCELHDDYGVENLAVIGLAQGDLNGDLRDKGIARACEEKGIKLLTETRGVSTVDDVTNAVEGIIASYPEVDGIFIVGGLITNGALAGATQALANHDMSDKVSIAMVDIAPGMSAYMGEGQPLKLVTGGNIVMDMVFAEASLINHAMDVGVESEPYVINTHMLKIKSAEDADNYDKYVESMTTPMISGDAWFDTLIGKDVEGMQAFSDNFSIDYARSLHE